MPKRNLPDNLYDLLEVSPRASREVIEAAFRVLIKKYHPDKDDETAQIAKSLNEARDILLDDTQRELHDKTRQKKEGSIIGNYRVLELIAEGGFGKTYKGEHVLLGTPVCIKHGINISPQDEEILRDEAKAIWDLRHFGIPSIRDLVKLEDGSLALIMSYIPGPTLEKIIKKNGKLEPEHIAWICERILNILKYLHYHGVVHGDVKPQNIIIQPESHTVVLVDYGLSMIRPKQDTQAVGYTPYYAPPEQEAGHVLLPQSDFYSLAVTMIYALGGDISKKTVPEEVPDPLCEYLRRFLVRDVLSRPNWEEEDFVDTITELREKVFGRRRSGFKPIPGF
ncbi:MAG: protein kinase [Spirochaetales bacterium]|nr:protein kinase [Spirochaetales bacterium]